uniref:hypothetical protein n=1 Tax=Xenorhabdus sp. PB61.4 TaxID=2788940 RepID=UPI001E4023E9|nr:hypothetical protein [Xenorhabdus sp. PB61.4]
MKSLANLSEEIIAVDGKTMGGIAVVESYREIKGKAETYERRYYITSHQAKTAQFIAYAIRRHWHIESKLH